MNIQHFSIDMNDPLMLTNTLKQGVLALENMRGASRIPRTLDWQIRAYKWIINQKDSEKRAKAWCDANATKGFKAAGQAAGYPEPCPEEEGNE